MNVTNDPLRMAAGEHGLVRVFALSLTPREAAKLADPARLAEALGAGPVTPGRAEVVAVRDLDGLGLAGYLIDGYGIPEALVAPDRARLDALDGNVLLLMSKAFGDATVTMNPAPELTLIGTYAEEEPRPPGPPVESDSARPGTGPRRKPPRAARAEARRAGAMVFTVIMALLALVVFLLVR